MTAPIVLRVAVPHIRSYPPDGPLADALEEKARRDLPLVDGLEQAQTHDERMQVYSQVIQKQRAEFVALYGDPFGLETRSVAHEQQSPMPCKVGNCVADAGS